MKLRISFLLILILIVCYRVNSQNENDLQLRFITFVFRHGIRSPITNFEDDPNSKFWNIPTGYLTTLGAENEYELGKWFRNHYGDFLSPYFNSPEIYLRSTDSIRCLQSAQLFAAGLYPPTSNETWNDELGKVWYPIPVHSRPIWIDPYYYDFARLYCPRYQQLLALLQKTPQYSRLYNAHATLEDLLIERSQQGYYNMTAFLNTGDTLEIEKDYNLTWPNWINQSQGNEALKLTDQLTWWYTKFPEEIKLAGGVMSKEIMFQMFDVITHANGNLKAYVVAGHDYTIINILRAMELFDFIYPDFSAAISIELYEDNSHNFFVQVLYKNETDSEPFVLNFPDCADKCPWQFVWDLISPYFAYNIFAACQPMSNIEMTLLQPQLNDLYP